MNNKINLNYASLCKKFKELKIKSNFFENFITKYFKNKILFIVNQQVIYAKIYNLIFIKAFVANYCQIQ